MKFFICFSRWWVIRGVHYTHLPTAAGGRPSKSGSLAILAAMRRGSLRVSRLPAEQAQPAPRLREVRGRH